jgi:polyisoprenoid-binding protein YceI
MEGQASLESDVVARRENKRKTSFATGFLILAWAGVTIQPPRFTRGPPAPTIINIRPTGRPVDSSSQCSDPMRYASMNVLRTAVMLLASVALGFAARPATAADEYAYDLVHSSVSFKARHLDISWIHGRFNEVGGKFSLDRENPEKSTFELIIKAESIDTANAARDEHLRQPDYFDVKQFPTIEFKSTGVKAIKGGYEVTGDFIMHGVTKEVKIKLMGGKESEFMGTKRVAFSTELALKRSDFDFDKANIGLIGDEALVIIDCEGTRK